MWIDADAFFEPGAERGIERMLSLAEQSDRDVVIPSDPQRWDCQNLCTGVMLWRATTWSRSFLKFWWLDGETRFSGTFRHSFSWEQKILNAIWKADSDKFLVVPHCTINAACEAPASSGAFVVHCMGEELKTRLNRIAIAEEHHSKMNNNNNKNNDNDDKFYK